jgi:hypothetical protein
MVPINLRLDASIRGLLGLSLGTLIGRTDSPARGIRTEGVGGACKQAKPKRSLTLVASNLRLVSSLLY